ncbi:hydantoinase/oxoprolinase [Coccidioides immitis RMSCC 3703]|uniref:Hydantoinase/oxoprolinase n=1 Tax=Coccidioides immitis RMSCC 3703 TaxID=454286 RepID=A0A0J8QTB8_COCIT|nr:hydantoinase/oxoprolinase [Coccidioides immitis RMSCC 3703]
MAAAIKPYRIGVDVGGTNTDAVILDTRETKSANRGVVAWHKTPTTSPNVTDGIEAAVRSVLDQSKAPRDQVACLTIERVPPFSDFPPVLKSIMNGYYCYVDGGLHIDGSQEAPINEDQIVRECAIIKEKGLDAVVISGVFSPIDDHFYQEDHVRRIVRRELPDVDIVCSSEVSQIGYLERENASILNASILKFARRTIRGFKNAMKRLDLNCTLYLTQNDGTLIDAPSAARLPIRTFSSGPTNSMRGAAYLGLSGQSDGTEEKTATIVVDIGGTTSDVGVLLPSGFPRQASAYVTVAGVQINFGMPHLESIGLGGGSIVRSENGKVTVGPDSVGHFLSTRAKVFGGDVLTATDIAVAAGEKIGDPNLVQDVDQNTVADARARMKTMLENVVDLMKTSPAPLPVLLVGGGSVIAPTELDGVSKVICPPFHSVANAVGAAMSKVGGTVDMIQSSEERTVKEIVEQAKETAIERAVASGALRETVYLAEVDALPLQYVANQVRVIARAVGELSPDGVPPSDSVLDDDDEDDEQIYKEAAKRDAHLDEPNAAAIDIEKYRPKTPDDEIVDRALRASCSEMGSRVGMAAKPTTTDRVHKYSVINTISLAWRIGRCIARAHANNTLSTVAEQMIDEIGGPETAKVLFRGKIIAVERRLFKGHSYGEITIQQTQQSEEEKSGSDNVPAVAVGGTLKIPFKNENIYAKHISETGEEKYIAMVPDLISVLDTQSGKALGVPEFRYGLMVTVLGIACSPRWSDTPRGLEYGGPGAFGYKNIEYKPLGTYVEPKSVVFEFAED